MAGVYLVGGSVRDLLLGGEPVDLDVVVDGDPAEVRSRLNGEVTVHDRFGTFTTRTDGFTYDVARARRERYPRPGALPEVEPAALQEDLGRRDFTVNAVALALGGNQAGELHTAPLALHDLAAGILRVLHDGSFHDDPTRLLRLARYSARLSFAVEPHTVTLAHAAIASGALGTVSGPRIGTELRLLASELDPVAALVALRELELDGELHPDFGLRDPDLARRALELLPAGGRRDRLLLAIAGLAIPAEELAPLLDRLAFEAADRDAIVSAAAGADALAERLRAAGRPSEIAAAVGGAPEEQVALAGALGPCQSAEAWLRDLSATRLEIAGADLLAAGVAEGPAVGQGLRAALAAKLDGQAKGRDAELAVALQAAAEASGQ